MQELEQDFKRDFFLNAQEAMDYGLVDKLTMPKRLAKLKAKDDPERGPNEEAAQKGAAPGHVRHVSDRRDPYMLCALCNV